MKSLRIPCPLLGRVFFSTLNFSGTFLHLSLVLDQSPEGICASLKHRGEHALTPAFLLTTDKTFRRSHLVTVPHAAVLSHKFIHAQ